MFSLKSKIALVTGAGRGIGQAIAWQLAAAGATVMLNDLDAGPLEETQKAIAGSAQYAGDLTDPVFPQLLVDRTIAEFGGIDIIVNNAGYTWDNIIQKTTDEQFQAMLDIHIVAPFRILRAAAPWIRDRAKREAAEGRRVHRKVVNITSISATDGGAGQAGYSSGKAAVIGLTRTMAKEWGRYSVNVNAVGFGLIETRLIQPLTAESAIEVKGHEIRVGVQPALLEKVLSSSPLGRAGTVEEAAGAVLFFCSPLSDFVTGEVLMCSGGMHFKTRENLVERLRPPLQLRIMPRRKPDPTPSIDENYVNFKLEIKPSKIHRWGVYAAENIPARRKVMEYTGERISRKETRRRSEEQGRMIYLFTLDNYWTLDGAVGGSGAQYCNHCCDPNIRTVIVKGHILYMSNRAIRSGEELTVDYHFAKDIERIACKCGSAKCRGTINLKD